MTQRLKVYSTGDRGIEIKEVDIEEAKKILAEAIAEGRIVVNKGNGEVISGLEPDVEELLIVDIVDGG
ncbi:hypothetical protein ES703_108874 [subsurface metagenome]